MSQYAKQDTNYPERQVIAIKEQKSGVQLKAF